MRKVYTKAFRWDDEIDSLFQKLIGTEADKPSPSVMLRRMIYRAHGMDDNGVRKHGRVPVERVDNRPEIARVGLSTRLSNTLINAGIETLEQLHGATEWPPLTPKLKEELTQFVDQKWGLKAS